MTQNQLAKVNAEIARLLAEAESLEKQAHDCLAEYDANWHKQDLKHFAGLPQSVAIDRARASTLRRKVELLELIRDEEMDLDELPQIQSRIDVIEGVMHECLRAKVALYNRIVGLNYLGEILRS